MGGGSGKKKKKADRETRDKRESPLRMHSMPCISSQGEPKSKKLKAVPKPALSGHAQPSGSPSSRYPIISIIDLLTHVLKGKQQVTSRQIWALI
jgi:hypothetical protein